MAEPGATGLETPSLQTPITAGEIQLPSLQALQSAEQMELLNAIDSLRLHGLGEIIALPQLIVCGDQSSGKSSVLEAISGVPFPTKDDVCTRFATEVILRRAPSVSMTVSIVPSGDLSANDQERISQFRHNLASKDDFVGLFEKAKEAMGLSDKKVSFSKNVLKVECFGPKQPQLTLVDLPGFIHSTKDEQARSDIELVKELVSSYLRSPRSIILAIVAASHDINTQIVIERIREVDPQGKRTLGIITKPDKISANKEGLWMKLANNEDIKYGLGWHIVKNLESGTGNVQQEARDELEIEFFKKSAFSVLPSQIVGIMTLRTRLSKVLFNQIQIELPKLLEDIESRICTTKAARDKLGPSRTTSDEQQNFLIELSQSFHTICRDAIGGHYDHDFFRSDAGGETRLCSNLMNKHFAFAQTLRRKGATWKVSDKERQEGHTTSEDENSSEEGGDENDKTRDWAIEMARRVLRRSRGRELPGLPNPLLVGELFRDYSRPWEGIARNHITDVWNISKRFLEMVLQYLTDDDVCNKILKFWLDPIMEQSLEAANNKLNELLEVHKDHPLTTNRDFVDNRRKLQQTKDEDSNLDMDLVAAEDALDNMNAYYKVAMKLFMDNVPTLAIQAPIVRRIPDMLSPKVVSTMDKNIIKKIAGESGEKALLREETVSRLAKLEKGAQICREYALRPHLVSRLAKAPVSSTVDQNPAMEAEQEWGRFAMRRGHSPSTSEDGRATARGQRSTLRVPRSPKPTSQPTTPPEITIGMPSSSNGTAASNYAAAKVTWSTDPAPMSAPAKPVQSSTSRKDPQVSSPPDATSANIKPISNWFYATTPSSTTGGSVFGSATSGSSPFSSTTGGSGIFGSTTGGGSTFGSATGGSGIFGSTTGSSQSGPATGGSGLFGSATGGGRAFGSVTPGGGSVFGSATTGGGSTFGSATGGSSIFGSTTSSSKHFGSVTGGNNQSASATSGNNQSASATSDSNSSGSATGTGSLFGGLGVSRVPAATDKSPDKGSAKH